MNNIPIFAGSINQNYDFCLENLLKLNKGKKVIIYTTTKEFDGILEQSFKDYIILSDPNDGKYYIILNKNINYICFLEQVNYY